MSNITNLKKKDNIELNTFDMPDLGFGHKEGYNFKIYNVCDTNDEAFCFQSRSLEEAEKVYNKLINKR